jgi:beta-galactosidase beta subunit
MHFIPPTHNSKSFNCANCGVLSEQTWSYKVNVYYQEKSANGNWNNLSYELPDNSISKCKHCEEVAIWKDVKMIFPNSGNVAIPNEDMPEDVKEDYLEAKNIINLSPRGAAALLRLGLQKLCVHLGEKGENINKDIKSLVSKGLPEQIQQALDSVRVIGNNAVHPGQIDLKDDIETAHKIFGFLNIICDMLITQPRKIKEFYDLKIPEGAKNAIDRRDKAE